MDRELEIVDPSKSFLAMIKNSLCTRMFRNCIGTKNGEEIDLTEDGELSCAFFVSCILMIFGFIKDWHLTVGGTITDLRESNWQETDEPVIGAVLVWESQEGHRHIGFYLGDQQAISNSSSRKFPTQHHWTFNGSRRIIHIFWHRSLDTLLEK